MQYAFFIYMAVNLPFPIGLSLKGIYFVGKEELDFFHIFSGKIAVKWDPNGRTYRLWKDSSSANCSQYQTR